ncbi:putative transcription factor C3H family [Lupinus albus]|uniref:Putative transcription factor C3H family n=1 Tax=Lupinus albus TaxID=3870 RepID=A0A6A4R3K7_LUPAL|nr:putative transcription factor C3H family [Lupinus albus]
MSSVCGEQHKFQSSHQLLSLKKSLRDIDIPPRKRLTRRATVTHDGASDMFSDDTLFQKYLPHNNMNMVDESDNDSDPYSSDHFRMYDFKVRKCSRGRSHDWTDCPFSHPGEKARRRDPRLYHYSSTVCPEYRRGCGSCSRGEACEFSHGVFECWLHPAKYRTEACKDGKNCKRKVCFFAHTPRQLRVLPVNLHPTSNEIINSCDNNNKGKFLNHSDIKHSCLFSHYNSCGSNCSPTSTLFGMSHFSSPPISPSASPANRVSPMSRFKKNLNWLDASFNCEDQHFALSPSTIESFPSSGRYSTSNYYKNEAKVVDDVNDPDLGWVNELLR